MELVARPDDLDALYAGSIKLTDAVEECLRWITPIQQFARTVTADTELSGVPVSEGDYLVMLYASANWTMRPSVPMAGEFDPRPGRGCPTSGSDSGPTCASERPWLAWRPDCLFEELAAVAPGSHRWGRRSISRRAWCEADSVPFVFH